MCRRVLNSLRLSQAPPQYYQSVIAFDRWLNELASESVFDRTQRYIIAQAVDGFSQLRIEQIEPVTSGTQAAGIEKELDRQFSPGFQPPRLRGRWQILGRQEDTAHDCLLQ